MGLMSTLFGAKPKFVERSLGETRQLDSARSQLAQSQQQRPLLQTYLKDIGNSSLEASRARGTANADVMQATSGELPFDPQRPGGAPLSRALTRAKALSRMQWAGTAGAEEDAFQAKMAAAQFGKRVKSGAGVANDALSAGQYSNKAMDNYLQAQRGAMVSGVIGTLAGAGAAAYNAYRNPPKAPSGWYQGNSYADLNPGSR